MPKCRQHSANNAWSGVLTREIFFLFRRGPIIVTELTTTPTLSAIVEFKNKESLEKVNKSFYTLLFSIEKSVARNMPLSVVLKRLKAMILFFQIACFNPEVMFRMSDYLNVFNAGLLL